MQTQPAIKVQAVQELVKCQGVLVVVQLLALARPMALQMQAAEILQASTFSSLPYCFLERSRGICVLAWSGLRVECAEKIRLETVLMHRLSWLANCRCAHKSSMGTIGDNCRTTHMSAHASSFRKMIVQLSILMYSNNSVAYALCAC